MGNKQKISIIVGVLTLIVLTFGATYSYFKVTTTLEGTSTVISTTLEDVGSVALKFGKNIGLNLSAIDLTNKEAGYFYGTESGTALFATDEMMNNATADEIREYINSMYIPIAKAEVVGDHVYSCTYKLKVEYAGNMAEQLQSNWMNLEISNPIGSSDNNYLSIDSTTEFPLEISGTLPYVSKNNTEVLYGSLGLTNLADVNQSAIAGKNMTLTVNATEFDCTIMQDVPEVEVTVVENTVTSKKIKIKSNVTGMYALEEDLFIAAMGFNLNMLEIAGEITAEQELEVELDPSITGTYHIYVVDSEYNIGISDEFTL